LDYRPGDYLQVDIPVYAPRSLRSVQVGGPYAALWEAQGVFDYTAENLTPTRRSYSMASNPAVEKHLRFNVRLATPPPGLAVPAGVGSAYIFGLQPGDTDGHRSFVSSILDTDRELFTCGARWFPPGRTFPTCRNSPGCDRLSHWFAAVPARYFLPGSFR
jgi:Na+-transporting NADH:ubiquinone oxidoreductase subunit NqrF